MYLDRFGIEVKYSTILIFKVSRIFMAFFISFDNF